MDKLSPASSPATASTSDMYKTSDEVSQEGRLRIVVDLNRCQAYAQCCFLAPEVFQLYGEEVLMYNPEADESRRDEVLRAAAACPVQAIMVEQRENKGKR